MEEGDTVEMGGQEEAECPPSCSAHGVCQCIRFLVMPGQITMNLVA